MPPSSKALRTTNTRFAGTAPFSLKACTLYVGLVVFWSVCAGFASAQESDALSADRSPYAKSGEVARGEDSHAALLGPRLTLLSEEGELMFSRTMARAAAQLPLDSEGIELCAESGQSINFDINATWRDENNDPHGLPFLGVAFVDADGSSEPPIICIAITDEDGHTTASFGRRGDGSGRFIIIFVALKNDTVVVEDASGTEYSWNNLVDGQIPPEYQNVTSGNFALQIDFFDDGSGSIYDAMMRIAPYVFVLRGSVLPVPAVVRFPLGPTEYVRLTNRIHVAQDDLFQWDVLHALYGQFAMDRAGFLPSTDGCPDFFFGCDTCSRKDRAMKQAWVTGWSTFFAVSGHQVLDLGTLMVPRVGDTLFEDTTGAGFSVDLMGDAPPAPGETNALSIARLFWQLLQLPDFLTGHFAVLDDANPNSLSSAWTALRGSLLGGAETELGAGVVLSKVGLGPQLISPVSNDTVPPIVRPGDLLSWTPGVGCADWVGDAWRPVFFPLVSLDPPQFGPRQTLSTTGANPRTLTEDEYAGLVATSHYHLWAVEGFSNATIQTGPYMGDSTFVVLNRVPVCDPGGCNPDVEECTIEGRAETVDLDALPEWIGDDEHGDGEGTTLLYLKECEGQRTSVQLDGSESSDADEDTLTYSWVTDCPNGVFDDPTSPTPTLTLDTLPPCPVSCLVVLDVSDGIESSQCAAVVVVLDTTPPSIDVPASDRTVECDGAYNIPELTEWLEANGGAVASDVCGNVTWYNDFDPNNFVIDCGPTGSIDVTFIAVDDCGVTATTTATFTIVDTTNPTIDCVITNTVQPVEVDRNCKAYIEFEITVTDGCCVDPNDVDITAGVLTDNATLGPIELDPLPPSGPAITMTGRVLISDLTCCPATVQITAQAVDCCDDPAVPCATAVDVIDNYPPVGACGLTHDHFGWNWVDNMVELTANEPTYWAALSGQPAGASPFPILDPGWLPGRPDPDSLDSSDRVLRGYVVAVAVNENGEEIRWNHLKGDAVLVNYRDGSAWEYNAYAFQAHSAAHGSQTGTPGTLHLDGTEYDACFNQLLLDFYAVGSMGLTGGCDGDMQNCRWPITVNTDLTLLPVSVDLRQDNFGPVTTKAKFDIWNMNEWKFSGTARCITCWDQALLSNYDAPNHFLQENLHSDKGKARIDGLSSSVCPGSTNAALLGVSMKVLAFDGGVGVAQAGSNLVGMGTQSAVIKFDTSERPDDKMRRQDRPLTKGDLPKAACVERVTTDEKGSLLIFPKVEIRWDWCGNVIQDTFIDLTNDYPGDVLVQMYLIHGDWPEVAQMPRCIGP